jgi:hypothetical protein
VDVPSRQTKQIDSRAKGFDEISVEWGGIEPNRLRQIAQAAIEQSNGRTNSKFSWWPKAEASEKAALRDLVSRLPPHTASSAFRKRTMAHTAYWLPRGSLLISQ